MDNSQQSQDAASPISHQVTNSHSVFWKVLAWYVPYGFVSTILTTSAILSFCILYCNTSPIEGLLILLALGSLVAALVYVPLVAISIVKGQSSEKKPSALFITLVGYAIIYGMVIGWSIVGTYNPNGWESSLNERIRDRIFSTVGDIRDERRESVIREQFHENSFRFAPTESTVTLVNSHDAVLSVTGVLSGLNNLGSESKNQQNLIIAEVGYENKVAAGNIASKLRGVHGSFGEELWVSMIQPGQDEQQITVNTVLPKEFAQAISSNPQAIFDVKVELLSMSPHTYEGTRFSSLWSSRVPTTPKYLGQFLRDRYREIDYKIPDSAVKFTKIDEDGNFVTESDNQVSYTVTTNPKQTLCCEMAVFRVSQAGNGMSVDDYLNNVPWRGEIIRKQVTKPGSFQLGIIEAHPTIASPYKAFIYSRYGEVSVYELTGRGSGLEELYNQYLEAYKRMFPYEWSN